MHVHFAINHYPLVKGRFKENIGSMCISDEEMEKFKQLCNDTSAYDGLAGVTTDGVCGFLRYGLTIDFNGNILICPYDVDSGLLFGHLSQYESMRKAYDTVQKRLFRFAHGRDKAMYCPLRHREYHYF